MAKGLRSKCKRANRSLIRKTLTEPIMRQRQAEMSEALKKELAEKRGDSITTLASLLPGNKAEIKKDEEDMEDENEEDATDNQQGGQLPKSGKQKGFSFLRRNPKQKGSKPRSNPGKEMVW
eukprot:CAMPEP_0170385114 /NCGR_PEP_ID=MMETSP0117_2-20130122/16347_1 /TAXON_ID=400756 /ORGANISM="Durinskia baltica, Strain CSIRO CS-38" /LENGTH=120 /DNA_ID=CAMNT_0010640885 /DNA_START=50 /DNA_END=409 /DNA_ORIENTATION=+